MKVFVNIANESWICDRFMQEWYGYNQDMSTLDPRGADVIWLLAGWMWQHMPVALLMSKPVVLTVHHIVPEKMTDQKQHEFSVRDRIVDLYHVPCERTKQQLLDIGVTEDRIFCQPFWANQNLWFDIEDKSALREKLGIDQDAYLVGSFQRDTEGSDLSSPKLEKGPDRFCDSVVRLAKTRPNVQVLLGGWRRQYVMQRLSESAILYHYHERASFDVVNEMYNCLDLYIVAARHEGGPQAIPECALTKTPIISTNVGLADVFLPRHSIWNPDHMPCGLAIPDPAHAWEMVQQYTIPNGFTRFRERFEELAENKRAPVG